MTVLIVHYRSMRSGPATIFSPNKIHAHNEYCFCLGVICTGQPFRACSMSIFNHIVLSIIIQTKFRPSVNVRGGDVEQLHRGPAMISCVYHWLLYNLCYSCCKCQTVQILNKYWMWNAGAIFAADRPRLRQPNSAKKILI